MDARKAIEGIRNRVINLRENHLIGSRGCAVENIRENCDDISLFIGELEKAVEVLEILKRKYVDLYLIRICIEDEQSYLRYNQEIIDCLIAYDKCELLTEDEYIKIKEWLDGEG